MKSTKGFTLIELLVVLTITTVLFGLGISSFTSYNRREQLKQAALTLKSNLRLAQTKAISANKPNSTSSCSPSAYPCCTTFIGERITFTSNSYSIRPECSPQGLVGSSQTISFATGISFSSTPASFTYLTRTNITNRSSNLTINITNGTETYRLIMAVNGSIDDLGIQ
jgi:prepilin-type N-terminal cleavage/methylation domain-containing protein